MLRKVLVILIFVCGAKAHGQLLDTLRELFRHKYNIDARLESRYSFVDHQLISVNGVRLGLSFQRKIKIGAGLSWLNSDVRTHSVTSDPEQIADTAADFLKFTYLAGYADFVFYKTRRWQLSVPIQLGTGMSWFQEEKGYRFNKNPKYFLLLYEPGITAQFKIFKWAGLGADVAYRFTLRNNRRTAERLNSPTYSFKILLWFDQLFYDVFPESPITKRFGPSYW